jgi:hypothetical protein
VYFSEIFERKSFSYIEKRTLFWYDSVTTPNNQKRSSFYMTHSTPAAFGLQSLLFSKKDLSPCFFREPTNRELEFMSFFHGVQSLLSSDELLQLRRYHIWGRMGYDLIAILGIQLLKLHYRQPTMQSTLLLLQENENLREILGISQVPSTASASRLARKVGKVVKPTILHERVIQAYKEGMNRTVGHLSIDSTTIQAREKPFVRAREVVTPVTQKKEKRAQKGRFARREGIP